MLTLVNEIRRYKNDCYYCIRYFLLIGVDCATNSLWYAEGGGDVTCPSRAGRHVVPVLMGLYILITNVLMLNLLIAYFK